MTFRGEVEYEMIWGAPPVISDPEMAGSWQQTVQ